MFGNLRVDDALADLAQSHRRSSIIALHKPAEANYVRDEDGGELASDIISTHGGYTGTRRRQGEP